jgi:hypothetical protein
MKVFENSDISRTVIACHGLSGWCRFIQPASTHFCHAESTLKNMSVLLMLLSRFLGDVRQR